MGFGRLITFPKSQCLTIKVSRLYYKSVTRHCVLHNGAKLTESFYFESVTGRYV